MKNKLPTILLTLSLTTLVGFSIGEELELDAFLNARTSPSFLKYSKNIATTLPKGTTGEVQEIKNFTTEKDGVIKNTGNAGIKMKITSGPKTGETYWVYFKESDPALKLIDKKTKKEVLPAQVVNQEAITAPEPEIEIEKTVPYHTLKERNELINAVAPVQVKQTNVYVPQSEKFKQTLSKTNVTSNVPVEDRSAQLQEEAENEAKAILAEAANEFETTQDDVAVKTPPQQNNNNISLKPTRLITSEVLRDVQARRDMSEHAMIETARDISETFEDNTIQKAITPKLLPCVAGPPAEEGSVYGPAQALSDINSGKLTFMGRVRIVDRGGQNYSCMYKNDKVYVVYNNCMGNKKESEATDIEIIAQNGDYFKFYLEIYDTPLKPSQMKRADYVAGTWDLSYAQGKPPGKMNIAQFKEYMEVRSDAQGGNACWTGGFNKVKDSNTKGACIGKLSSKQSEWAEKSEEFWRNPSNEWYETQQNLRKTIQNTSF